MWEKPTPCWETRSAISRSFALLFLSRKESSMLPTLYIHHSETQCSLRSKRKNQISEHLFDLSLICKRIAIPRNFHLRMCEQKIKIYLKFQEYPIMDCGFVRILTLTIFWFYNNFKQPKCRYLGKKIFPCVASYTFAKNHHLAHGSAGRSPRFLLIGLLLTSS